MNYSVESWGRDPAKYDTPGPVYIFANCDMIPKKVIAFIFYY